MKKMMLVVLAVVASGSVWAAEDKLGVDVDLTWLSKTIWRGIDVGDNKAAFMPSATFDLWGTGFSTSILGWWSGAESNGSLVNGGGLPTEKYVYMLTYANSFNKGDAAQVDYNLTYSYNDYYTNPSWYNDYQDLALTVSLPKMCPAGFVPRYTVAYSWSGRPGPTPGFLGGTELSDAAGFFHMIGLDYNFKLCDQPFTLSADAVYNDGAFAIYGPVSDHDWSHITWGLRTAFKVWNGMLIPGIYYQTSMDDSVNENDEFYTAISYKISF
ncbi:MAG: hypothetical protein GX455_03925 [Phycisphaerae bacterium]|nr:hypothetical protein [Phycisphaerae bacterium]